MNVVFLNPENSLFIESETLPLTKNGYLFMHDFRAGESGKCTFLSGGESVLFSASPEFFLRKNPAFTPFFGKGGLSGALFLSVNPLSGRDVAGRSGGFAESVFSGAHFNEIAGAAFHGAAGADFADGQTAGASDFVREGETVRFFGGDAVRVPQEYAFAEKRQLPGGGVFYYFCAGTDNTAGLGRSNAAEFTPDQAEPGGARGFRFGGAAGTSKGDAVNFNAAQGNRFGGAGFYVLLSAEKRALFSAPAGLVEVAENEGTFRVIRNIADLRRHKTDAVRRLSDGKIVTYMALPQAYVDPRSIDELLLSVAFLEEVFVSGAVEDFLSGSLRPRAKEIGSFLGDFCGVLPAKEPNAAVLLQSSGSAETVRFSVREGVIYDLFIDDGT